MSAIFGSGNSASVPDATAQLGLINQQQGSANAQQVFGTAAPGITQASDYYSGILNGGTSLTTGLAPSINATEAQFQAAQQSLLNSSYARGGGLTQGMNNLAAGKAQTLSNLFSGAQSNAASSLSGLDLGLLTGSNQTMQTATQAGSGAASSSLTQQQITNQGLSGVGSLLAALLGLNG